MKRTILAALLAVAPWLGGAGPVSAADAGLQISDAWARPTIPTRPGAGYLTLRNAGDAPDVLLGAKAEGAGSVELHITEEANGVINMLRLESLEIAPGEEVVLTPGHMHLMFMNLDAPLAEGETFRATLIFEEAGEVPVEFVVGAEPEGTDGGADDEADGGAD